jgi:hypothetical protein
MRVSMTIFVCAFFFLLPGRLQRSARGVTTMMPAAAFAGSTWAANGASACKKLLTADFLRAILVHPAGESESEEQSCSYSADSGLTTFKIELSDHITLEGWERYNKQNRPKAIALAGVGDKAVRSENPDVVYAWKNGDRTCGVMLVAIGEQPKLTGEALAKKLGGICNQLFALP